MNPEHKTFWQRFGFASSPRRWLLVGVLLAIMLVIGLTGGLA